MAEVCTTCGLPKDLCVCEELEKEETRIVVRLEMRRFRKPTTMVEGLQGDHRDQVRDSLVNMGFGEGTIEVQ
jgi:translation initiation factor 1